MLSPCTETAMHLNVLPLLVCSCLAQGTPLDNLDFSSGTLSGWQGQGFAVLAREDKNAKQAGAVTSRDTGTEGRTGVLHRSLVVPADAAVILFAGCAVLGKDCAA